MNNNDEIIRLLKHGQSEEIKYYNEAQKKENYPADFSAFMDKMLDEYHVKRKEVAIRAGLSQDYTYKLLRGDKRTKERDYILAICIAVGMNIAQTQHALEISGMQILNRNDPRSNIIYMGIENRVDIDEMNRWLEKCEFVYLKTSPDMPSAGIEICGDYKATETESIKSTVRVQRDFEEVDRQIEAEPCGDAPMDYIYWGIISVQDKIGNKYFVEAYYAIEGEHYCVLDEENYSKQQSEDDPEEDTVEVLEEYDSIVEAGQSDFFKFFLEIDKATDKKVIETMAYIDDTRNYGVRIGAGFHGKKKTCYLEAFNTDNPGDREYLQIIQEDGAYTFSVSRESYFMRIELGVFYPIYFGEKRKPEYVLKVNKTAELQGEAVRYRFVFEDLLLTMHQYAKKTFRKPFDTNDKDIEREIIEALIRKAVAVNRNGQYKEALALLEQSIELMKAAESKGEDYTVPLMCTYYKIVVTYGNLGDDEKLFDTFEILYQMKERIPIILKEKDERKESAVCVMAKAMLHKAYRCQKIRGEYDEEAKKVIVEAIDFLEGNCTDGESWAILFELYLKYAYMIDIDAPEQAVIYYRKAVKIVNVYHLDSEKEYQDPVYTLYNNYAWVLWNKLGSEEAIIYYGRAIELEEGILFQGTEESDLTIAHLQHVGEALLKLYRATNKEKEAQRLISRLAEDGIKL